MSACTGWTNQGVKGARRAPKTLMSFQFEENETIPEGIRRIAIEQIDKAQERSRWKGEKRAAAIHDVRICFKKIRAVLRLVRRELDASLFDEENQFYRDAGRRLSPLRNQVAMIETYDQVIERLGDEIDHRRFAHLRRRLDRQKNRSRGNAAKILGEVSTSLHNARRRVPGWPLHADSFGAIEAGLGETYKHGRSAFAAAYDDRTVEGFHEWRKPVKYLGYQTRILRPIWPPVIKELANQLKTLGGYLSEDHDLALLRGKIKAQNSGQVTEEVTLLAALIDERRQQLQDQAKELAGRIYVEKRGEFVRRIGASWRAWRPATR
ncbi:MAG: CHAD domain-containing protein [Terriglobia bacterium]